MSHSNYKICVLALLMVAAPHAASADPVEFSYFAESIPVPGESETLRVGQRVSFAPLASGAEGAPGLDSLQWHGAVAGGVEAFSAGIVYPGFGSCRLAWASGHLGYSAAELSQMQALINLLLEDNYPADRAEARRLQEVVNREQNYWRRIAAIRNHIDRGDLTGALSMVLRSSVDGTAEPHALLEVVEISSIPPTGSGASTTEVTLMGRGDGSDRIQLHCRLTRSATLGTLRTFTVGVGTLRGEAGVNFVDLSPSVADADDGRSPGVGASSGSGTHGSRTHAVGAL